jgi:ABC-type ATPase involved in cell division
VLLYGSETGTVRARDGSRITAAGIKYMRKTAGYIWTDYKNNTQSANELNITSILDILVEYKRNWIQHV